MEDGRFEDQGMAIRKIVYLDNPILREKARKVRVFDGKLHQLLDDMRETLLHAVGVGLAAPQVNVPERVIVVRLPDDEESKEEYGELAGVWFEVVNPEIIKASREMVEGVEGCLSIPGYLGRVDRNDAVTVRGQDRHGKEIRIKAYEWLARVFLHEIDHLDGVLYIDRASEVWKSGEEPPSGEAARASCGHEDARITGDP
jgi:peptide deformylase